MISLKIVALSVTIVLVHLIIGHFFAPYGLFFTPMVLMMVSILIALLTKELVSIWKSVVLAVLIGFHDIGIKLYSGGRHDYEGLGFLQFMLFVGLVPAFVILLIGIIRNENDTKFEKWLAVILFPIIVSIHLLIFRELGLGRSF